MKNRTGNILWGLILIIVGIGYGGAALGAWDFNIFFDGWWTLFIIIPCFIEIIQNGFNMGNVFGLLTGVVLLLVYQDVLDGKMVTGLIVPIILVAIGFRMIFPAQKIKRMSDVSGGRRCTYYSAAFSERRYAADSTEEFGNCSVSCSCGRLELDLRAARIEHDAELVINNNFGRVVVMLPQNIRADISGAPFLGGINNHFCSSCMADVPTLGIRVNTSFGSVEIR